jgi:hypothetical protein
LNVEEYISSGAIEACILGQATPEENDYYQEMRKLHPEVTAFANDFEEKLEAEYLNNTAVTPAADLFDHISEKLLSNTPVVPIQKAYRPNTVPAKPMWAQYAAVASVALLLGSTIFNFILAGKVKELQTKVNEISKTNLPKQNGSAQFAFLQQSDITPVALYGVGIHSICKCSLYWDKNKNIAYFQIHHLFPPAQEKDYQVWAQVDGKPVSLGILKYNVEKMPIAIPNIPKNATQFTVTLENKGGNTKPTLEEIYLMGQIST